MNNPAIEAYRNTSFEAAPPLKILRMLYAGAVRFLEQARELDPATEAAKFTERLSRADAIITELRCAIEPDHAPDLANQLDSLYLFVENKITTAVIENDPAPIDDAIQVLETLRSAWDALEVPESERGAA